MFRIHQSVLSCRRLNNSTLFWREDNLKEILMNIGYTNVPKDKIREFEKALDSFQPIEK